MNASPFVCPLWELRSADLEPADEDQLNRLARRVQSDDEFVGRIVAAARTTDRTYPPSDHVELQIYGTGWPSDEDVVGCRHFHDSPWEMRLDIVLGLADPRFRQLGRRLVYFERPDLLRPVDRAAFDAEVARRLRGSGDFLWTTLPQALGEIKELITAAPEQEQASLRRLGEEMRDLDRQRLAASSSAQINLSQLAIGDVTEMRERGQTRQQN